MKKKILMALALIGCAIVLVAGTIAGTVAYLTSTTGTISNTFTVGNIVITLDEAPVDDNGKATNGTRVTNGNAYHLVPGGEYDKDPTVHVAAKSDKCYLFVKVENNLAGIEGANTIASQMNTNGWTALGGVNNVYYQIVDACASNNAVDVQVFSKVTVNKDVNNATLASYANETIKVTAYAIQYVGFNDAGAAWTAGGFN